MKKLVFCFLLVNLLAACAIRTPFNRTSTELTPVSPAPITTLEPVKADNTKMEAPKPGSFTGTDVTSSTLDNNISPETASSGDAAPKAEANGAVATDNDGKSETANGGVGNTGGTNESSAKDKVAAMNEAATIPTNRSVHFPYDADAIQPADKATIQAHGAYLSAHPDKKVQVEGNADERGSSEYNLALGQRRANHTKKALVLAGAKVPQIEAISYGEEKPQATGHDETAWAQNRRADIVYK